MIILGIDPGYDRLGWGVLKKEKASISYLACGIIQTDKKDMLQERLKIIHAKLTEVIEKYSPDLGVVEELFFSNNQKTVIAVAQSRGVILMCLALQNIEIIEYTPSAIKSMVTGNGQADKKAVEKMMRLQLQGIPEKMIDDTLDALAGAYAHAVTKKYG